MSPTEILVCSSAVLVLLFRRGPRSSVMAYVAAYFAFFSLGPVVNTMRGEDIYEGTVVSEVPDAGIAYLVVLVAWLTVDLLARDSQALRTNPYWRRDDGTRWTGYSVALFILTLYGGFFALQLAVLSPFEKAVSVGTAPALHYQYVLLETIALSMLFFIWPDKTARKWYFLNAVVFIAYGLLSAERDFIFLIFSLFVHATTFGLLRSARWTPIVGGTFAVLGTWIFATRGNGDLDTTGVLNQGSLLFVDTYLLSRYPINDTDATHSYWNMISGGSSSGFTSLSDWFVQFYLDSHAKAGYGFSLVGEARLNAGLVGVFVVFALLAVFHKYLLTKATTWRPALFFAPLFITFLMYSMRGDLDMLLSTLLYGAVFLLVVWLTRTTAPAKAVPRTTQPSTDPAPRVRAGGATVAR
ncbi:hypothetical protein CYJ76_01530 [Kytococcus schroeteri]|uniref:Oligosaccharide repeat unit polymerase n=2 Tax=Kytococcus schroeteri TaxID=138300 RepID=A0A2I1PD58_9MICO|nr:hypothetical protein CYJ76_01530 [Kytococcus schroeteri]